MGDERSLQEVAADVVHETQRVVQRHIALASAELGETGRSLARRAVQLAIGLVLALVGVTALAAAGVLALTEWGLRGWLAALIVAGVCLAIGGIAAMTGITGIRKTGFLPHTMAALRGSSNTVQESVS